MAYEYDVPAVLSTIEPSNLQRITFDIDANSKNIVLTEQKIEPVSNGSSTVNVAKGVVKVYTNISAATWVQVGGDIETDYYYQNPTNNNPTRFGDTVKITSDGTRIVVGEPYWTDFTRDSNGNVISNAIRCGRVRVYDYDGISWVQKGPDIKPDLSPGRRPYNFFGNVISISTDGLTIAVGAPGSKNSFFASDYGYVNIYKYNSSTNNWDKQQDTIWNSSYYARLIDPSAPLVDDGLARYQDSIDISDDGYLIVGYPSYIGSSDSSQGKIALYNFTSTRWSKIYEEFAVNNKQMFGKSVNIRKTLHYYWKTTDFSVTNKRSSVSDVSEMMFYRYKSGNASKYSRGTFSGAYSSDVAYEQERTSNSWFSFINWERNKLSFDISRLYTSYTHEPIVTFENNSSIMYLRMSSVEGTIAFLDASNKITILDSAPPPPPTPTPTRTSLPTPTPTDTPSPTSTPTTTETPTTTPSPTETKCRSFPEGLSPDHLFDIQNTQSLEDENGDISLLGNGGSITVNGYEFEANQGLTLIDSLLDISQYSISIDFSILNTTYPIKVFDFKNTSFNNGIYYLPTSSTTGKINLRFEPVSNIVSDVIINTNVRNRLTLIRTLRINPIAGNVLSRTPVLKVLLNNIVLFEVEDSENFSVPENNVLQLFIDDVFTSNESGPGIIHRIATYNSDISQECYLQNLPSPTPTLTSTATPTPTNTETPLPTIPLVTESLTPFPTATPSHTPTNTETPTQTASPGASPTATMSATPTETPTLTPTVTPTQTLSPTVTPSVTVTKTRVSRFARGLDCCIVDLSPTPTASVTASVTQTPTHTPTNTATQTQTPTQTATQTQTPTQTATQTQTPTQTATQTQTPTGTATQTPTVTSTVTQTQTPSTTTTLTATPTATTTTTLTATPSPTPPGFSELAIFIDNEIDSFDNSERWKKKLVSFSVTDDINTQIIFPEFAMSVQYLKITEKRYQNASTEPYYLDNLEWIDVKPNDFLTAEKSFLIYPGTNDTTKYIVLKFTGTGFVSFKTSQGSLYPSTMGKSVLLKNNTAYDTITALDISNNRSFSLFPELSLVSFSRAYNTSYTATKYRKGSLFVYNSGITKVRKLPDRILSQNVYPTSYITFTQCRNLTSVPKDLPGTVISIRGMFNSCDSINDTNIGDWNTENITNMAEVFANCFKFNVNLNNWNTSKVLDMNSMFLGAVLFNNGDATNLLWDTSSVVNMRSMFQSCISFNKNLNHLNVSKVENMQSMFYGASKFNSPLSLWNTSSVKNMNYMFGQATAFNKNINTWNVANVTNMADMFSGSRWTNKNAFNQPLDRWNVSKVTNMNGVFSYCNFNQNITRWDVRNVVSARGMFQGNTVFNQNVGLWNTQSLKDARHMFSGATSFKQPLINWNISNFNNSNESGSPGASYSSLYQFLYGTNIGIENYNATLNAWSGKERQNNIYCDFGLVKKNTDSLVGFYRLLEDSFWTIEDGDGVNDSGDIPIQA